MFLPARTRSLVRRRPYNPLPGFGITTGYTLTYLALVVLIPLSALLVQTAGIGWPAFWSTVTDPRVVSAGRLTFGLAATAAIVNAVLGSILAWTLVRYTFPGKSILDAMVDLPFALPTAVTGIALTTVYSRNGILGQWFYHAGIETAYSPLGIAIALVFIGFPFVVRTVQPVMIDLERGQEEAAASLGARRFQIIRRIILPDVLPAIISGFTLAFARGIGEYGSVVFISGNMPMRTEIVPLLIVTKLEQYDFQGAAALGTVMLVISFVLLLVINFTQWLSRRHIGRVRP